MKRFLLVLSCCLLMCGCSNADKTKIESGEKTNVENETQSCLEEKCIELKTAALNICTSYQLEYTLAQLKGNNEKINLLKNGLDNTSGVEVAKILGISGDLPKEFNMLHFDENENVIITFSSDGITCTNYGEKEIKCY